MFSSDSEGNPFCELGTDHLVVLRQFHVLEATTTHDTARVFVEFGVMGYLTEAPSTPRGRSGWRFSPSVGVERKSVRVVQDSAGTLKILCRELVPNHISTARVERNLQRLDSLSLGLWREAVRAADSVRVRR